jgi:tRNA1Val (adenine37-N6)-methyltransferase
VILKEARFLMMRRELAVPVYPDETLDKSRNERLKIIQKRRGYRYARDSILLASFCHLGRGNRVIDLGTGSAIIPILLATQNVATQFTGVEIQSELIDVARRNVKINGMEGRISLIHGDVRELPNCIEAESFDVAISNPPYHPVRTGRINPHRPKAFARHEILGSLDDMVRVARFLLRPHGRFYVIYPGPRLVDMLLTLRKSNFEPKGLQNVHANIKTGAKLVMAEAVKDGGRELRILEPLFVYDHEGRYTLEMERIYNRFQSQGRNFFDNL